MALATERPEAAPTESPGPLDAPRRRRPWRIGSAGRLASLHAVVLTLVLGAVVFLLVRSFSASYESVAASTLGSQLAAFQGAAFQRPATQSLRQFAIHYLEVHPLPSGAAVAVVLRPGGAVLTGDAAALLRDPRLHAWSLRPPSSTVALATTIGGEPLEVLAAPIRSRGATIGTYLATSDLAPFAAERSRVFWLSVAEAAIALAVGVASAFLLLRRLLRRVGRITTTAEGIGSRSLAQRLGEQGDEDEVGELAHTFDTMLDRLETAMRSQRRLLADVSHQLRTPVTVVRGHLEVLSRTNEQDLTQVHASLELVIRELDHMTSLIERLLSLGRAMEPELATLEPVVIREFLAETLESVRVIAPRDYELRAVPALAIEADRRQLRGALTNLLENAIHATAPGDTVALGARLEPGGHAVAVEVEDSGPGIPAAQRDAVLQRFARPGARDEGGSGLGLAIARAVALAHGGQIWIDQSPDFGGARVALVLPVPLPAGGR